MLVLVAALYVPRQALAQKMYWIDVGADKIQRADLDGSSVEDLISIRTIDYGSTAACAPVIAEYVCSD